jgi:hypothetical protein
MGNFMHGASIVKQRGQSMMEYVVVTAALAAALFLPVPEGQADNQNGKPVWQYLASSFEVGYERFSHAISLPY